MAIAGPNADPFQGLPSHGDEDYKNSGHRLRFVKGFDIQRNERCLNLDFLGQTARFYESDIRANGLSFVTSWLDHVLNSHLATGAQNVPGQSPQALHGHPAQPQPRGAAVAGPRAPQLSSQQLAALYGTGKLSAQQYNQLVGQLGGLGAGPLPGPHSVAPAPTPKPLKNEGVRLGEIIAWRGWNVSSTGLLESMTARTVWAPGEVMDGSGIKTAREHVGVYAYKLARDFLNEHGLVLPVYGKVALWGAIIEHEKGYRAEFAKIISLEPSSAKKDDLHKRWGVTIGDLRQRYGVAA